MKLVLQRLYQGDDCIIGTLQLDDEILCYTLENPWKNNLPFKSSIPEGEYECKPYNSQKYPEVWEVTEVTGRSKILIHRGNYERNTSGCILVGRSVAHNNENMVTHSRVTLEKLRGIIGIDKSFTLKIRGI